MKIGDVKLLKRLSKPLTELLDYEIHKETAGGPRRFPKHLDLEVCYIHLYI